MKIYVLGFAFSPDDKVLLIKKAPDRGPEDVRGKWNGIGGSVEEGETTRQAMAREFQEETGIITNPDKWKSTVALAWPYCIVECFTILLLRTVIEGARQTTDEPVQLFQVRDLPPDVVPNLKWLVPLHMDCAGLQNGRLDYGW